MDVLFPFSFFFFLFRVSERTCARLAGEIPCISRDEGTGIVRLLSLSLNTRAREVAMSRKRKVKAAFAEHNTRAGGRRSDLTIGHNFVR